MRLGNNFLIIITTLIVLPTTFFSNFNYSQTNNIDISSNNMQVEITKENTEIIQIPLVSFEKELAQLNEALSENYYSQSIFIIDELKYKVLEIQKKNLNVYFPTSFRSFIVNDSGVESNGFFGDESFAVLFNKSYINEKNSKIDINMVHADPSIQEYISIVNNPRLADGMLNTTILTVQGYNALYSITENDEITIYEQNIILNEDLMITLIYVGLKDDSVLVEFLETISLQDIENYLKK